MPVTAAIIIGGSSYETLLIPQPIPEDQRVSDLGRRRCVAGMAEDKPKASSFTIAPNPFTDKPHETATDPRWAEFNKQMKAHVAPARWPEATESTRKVKLQHGTRRAR